MEDYNPDVVTGDVGQCLNWIQNETTRMIVSAVQMNSTADLGRNLETAERWLRAAAAAGAKLAALPENFAFMGAHETDKLPLAEPDGDGRIQNFLASLARELKLWIVAGTVPLAVDGDSSRVWPACLVYDERGERAARYDKIHLFDVEVPGGERYRESATMARGAVTPVVVDTPVGRLGLSICYDLRFPELYRALMEAGAELLCIPAAFTHRTGEAHWDALLRARAIENQCYVIAPAQYGTHASGRRTWGHSRIIDPWGGVLGCRGDDEGLVSAQIDLQRLREQRASFPVLSHRRLNR
jgi:nitrilase